MFGSREDKGKPPEDQAHPPPRPPPGEARSRSGDGSSTASGTPSMARISPFRRPNRVRSKGFWSPRSSASTVPPRRVTVRREAGGASPRDASPSGPEGAAFRTLISESRSRSPSTAAAFASPPGGERSHPEPPRTSRTSGAPRGAMAIAATSAGRKGSARASRSWRSRAAESGRSTPRSAPATTATRRAARAAASQSVRARAFTSALPAGEPDGQAGEEQRHRHHVDGQELERPDLPLGERDARRLPGARPDGEPVVPLGEPAHHREEEVLVAEQVEVAVREEVGVAGHHGAELAGRIPGDAPLHGQRQRNGTHLLPLVEPRRAREDGADVVLGPGTLRGQGERHRPGRGAPQGHQRSRGGEDH